MMMVRDVKQHSAAGATKAAISALGVELSLLNHHLSARLGLRTVDLDCLNLIHRRGRLSVGELARHVGLAPATTTGIVDRLERAGWVVRERPDDNRRTVQVRALPDREPELFALLGGVDEHLDAALASYTDAELELVTDFLRRTAAAAQAATAGLSAAR